jgi:hypothetical protein
MIDDKKIQATSLPEFVIKGVAFLDLDGVSERRLWPVAPFPERSLIG